MPAQTAHPGALPGASSGAPVRPRVARALSLALETHISLPLFAILLLVAVWIATFHFIGIEHRNAMGAARDAAREQVETYEAQLGRNLAGIDQTLKVLKYAVEVNGPAGALAALRQQALLPPALIFVVSVADKDGRVVASNPGARPIDVSHERYFTIHREQSTNRPFVSQTMSDGAKQEPHLHFTRRLNDAGGEFAGIAIVEADPAYFTSAYERWREGEHGVLGLLGSDGVARALRVGERLSWGEAVPLGEMPDDAIEATASLPDGVLRYMAVRRLNGFDLAAVVGLALDEQLAPYRKLRANYLYAAGGASAVLVLIVALIAAWSWQLARTRKGVQRAQETYAAASEASPDAFFVVRTVRDADGEVTDFLVEAINSRAQALTGLARTDMIGRLMGDVLPQYRTNGIFDDFRQVALSGQASETEWHGELASHKRRWLQRQVVAVETGLVIIVRDITERKHAEQRIFHMAHHDELTGLPNRSLITQRLELAVGDARRDGSAVLVCFIDLDGFKLVNDGLGHQAGDELLKITASRMQACVRQQDTVGRLGGDEFVLILPWSMEDMSAARGLLDTILAAVTQPLTLAGQEVQISCSIGVSLFPRDGDSADKLLVNADAAMYRAKSSGKNNYQFFDEEMNASGDQKLSLLEGLRHGIEQGQFRLLYQPKIDLHTNRIFGVEALVRWQHPQRGVISPMRFIPLAEESGLIVELGEWVLRQACLQNQAWRDAGLAPITIAVNVSPRQFDDRRLVERVTLALADSGLAPQGLELEVTESLTMRDIPQAVVKMEQLAAMGLSLSIDDFGTGFSSLASLKSYPLTRLKIDQSFVRDLDGRLQDQAIVRAVIAMAHQMQLRVIAEGVETAEQRDFLLENGCDEMQGYLYSHPVDAAAIAALLMAQRS